MKYTFSLTSGGPTAEQLRAEREFRASMDAAQMAPLKRNITLPFESSSFFCPGVVQREFIVVGRGDSVNGRAITHLATEHVSSCCVLVLHSDGDQPVTGLAHLDWKTDILRTIGAMLAEFPVKPSRADFYSSAFHQRVFDTLITTVNPDIERAKRAVQKLDSDRWNVVVSASTMLFDHFIPVTQIKLDAPSATFIAQVDNGLIWAGEEPPGAIFHHRDINAVLGRFFGSGQDSKVAPAVNPYAELIKKAGLAMPASLLVLKNQ